MNRLVWTPDALLSKLKENTIRRDIWWPVVGIWVTGLFAHGYMFTNKLPNHDDIADFWGNGGSILLGRWARDLMSYLDGGFSSPWMLGIVTLLIFSLTAILLTKLLRLKSPLFCALAGAVLVTFPSVISMMSYMFMVDTYTFALLLSILSVRLSSSGGWRRLAAVGCIVFSMGLYQGLIGWTIALMIYALLMRCLDEDAAFWPIFREGLWDLCVLVAGVAGYIGVSKLVWKATGIGPMSYQGIDRMGQIDFQTLPRQIWDCYRLFYNIFRSPSEGICSTVGLRLLLTGCELLAIILIGVAVLRQFFAGKRLEACLAALLGLLMPIGMNIVYLMGAEEVHLLMLYPMCMIPLVFLSQCEQWNTQLPQCKKLFEKYAHTIGRWICVCLVVLLVGRYAQQANEAYLCLQVNHNRRMAYWTVVVAQIKNFPEYNGGRRVVLVNEGGEDPSVPAVWNNDELNDMPGILMPMHVYTDAKFLSLYVGFSSAVNDNGEYAALPEVQEMPSYPDEGSIRLVNDVIVVKF